MNQKLVAAARAAQKNAYARYSGFKVGAAISTRDGKIFGACNVENASYGLSICAERAAVFKAVSEGNTDLVALAVFSDSSPSARPCGACLQVLFEFNPDMTILCANDRDATDEFRLTDLLPQGFRLK